MADKKISELNAASTIADGDDLPLVQAAETKQVAASVLKTYVNTAPTISGGTIDNATVGASTPAAGAFTSLTSSSTTTLNGTTIPASKTLLVSTDIGSTVQAYDSDLTAWAGKTAPTGDAVGTSDTQTLTNKTISGANNTLSNIGNSSLTNSSITINGSATSLGGSVSVGTVTSVSGTGTVSGLTLTGTVTSSGSLTLGGALDLSAPPAIGGTTPAAGAFTTLSSTGNTTIGDAAGDTLTINAGTTTFAQGTANGVLYLNGSKVATSGSGLVFDGANLGVGVSPTSRLQVAGAIAAGNDGSAVSYYYTGGMAIRGSSAGALYIDTAVSGGTDIIFRPAVSETARITSKGLLVGYTSDASLSSTGNAIFSGKVGIGTSSPDTSLVVGSSGGSQKRAIHVVSGSGGGSAGGIYIESNTAAGANGATFEAIGKRSDGNGSAGFSGITALGHLRTDTAIAGAGQVLGSVWFGGNPSGTTTADVRYSASIVGVSDAAWSSSSAMGTALAFYTGASGLDINATIANPGTERMRIDSSGNLGLGVTPSAWGAGYKALQVGPAASLVSETNANTRLYNNAYFDGSTVKYVNSAQASQYLQFQGQHLWLSAPSGTAGNAITFTQAMTLDASGNLSLTGGNSLTQSSTSNSVFGTQNTGGGGNVYGGFQALTNQTFRIGTFGSSNAHNIEFVSQNNVRLVMNTSGTFYPAADNSITCGQNGNRWAAIWAANGTIQTSDLSTKTSILDSPLGLDFITSLRPVAYKFKVGKNTIIDNTETGYGKVVPVAGKRQHFGFIAQEVKAVLPDDLDFGGWIQTDLDDPNSEQGLRYDEFIAPIVKAIQELAAEIELLKSKLN